MIKNQVHPSDYVHGFYASQRPQFPGTTIIISGEQGYHEGVLEGHDVMVRFAKAVSAEVTEITGQYSPEDPIERAVMVGFKSERQARQWASEMAHAFGQDSYVVSTNGNNELVYPRGNEANVKGIGTRWFDEGETPDGFFSTLPNGQRFSFNLKF